jgi:hypothetical protein
VVAASRHVRARARSQPARADPLHFALARQLAVTFCFEVLTDIAFLPPLMIMWRYRRHFELYVGIFQLVTGFLYNFCNALNVNVFLTELQWHGLNNILTTTYFLLLLIHLQANSNPTVDIVLRYAAFTAVWIAQIKDEYWNPYYTAIVVLAFCLMPVCKFGGAMRLPPYDFDKLFRGFFAGCASAVCFLAGLDDSVDPYRIFHGLSQMLVGLALYYLWQLVPLNLAKKTDEESDEHEAVDTVEPLRAPMMHGSRGMNRVMSMHDVPLSRVEYY